MHYKNNLNTWHRYDSNGDIKSNIIKMPPKSNAHKSQVQLRNKLSTFVPKTDGSGKLLLEDVQEVSNVFSDYTLSKYGEKYDKSVRKRIEIYEQMDDKNLTDFIKNLVLGDIINVIQNTLNPRDWIKEISSIEDINLFTLDFIDFDYSPTGKIQKKIVSKNMCEVLLADQGSTPVKLSDRAGVVMSERKLEKILHETHNTPGQFYTGSMRRFNLNYRNFSEEFKKLEDCALSSGFSPPTKIQNINVLEEYIRKLIETQVNLCILGRLSEDKTVYDDDLDELKSKFSSVNENMDEIWDHFNDMLSHVQKNIGHSNAFTRATYTVFNNFNNHSEQLSFISRFDKSEPYFNKKTNRIEVKQDKPSFDKIAIIAAMEYKVKNPNTFLTEKQIIAESKLFANKHAQINFKELLERGFQILSNNKNYFNRLVDEIMDYCNYYDNYIQKQFFLEVYDHLMLENIKAVELWLAKQKNKPVDFELPIYIPPVRRTFPRTVIKNTTKPKEEIEMTKPNKKEEIIQPEYSQEIADFFKQRALTVDECLSYLNNKFPNSVIVKKDTYFIRIPPNQQVKDSKESNYEGTAIDRMSESFIKKYGITVHPGHGGIEERDRPYYLREIIKGLRVAGWIA